jgi:hypothetical protein
VWQNLRATKPVETANPEWFIWQSDQGYLPLEQVKKMLQRFGKEIVLHYL